MTLKVERVDTWAATMRDQPGGLAAKLSILVQAGADLEFVISRRAPERPRTGVVFVTPLVGARQLAAARKAGFKKATSLHTVRVAGPDKPGMGAKITQALGAAAINLRGFSAAAIGKRFVCHIALDTVAAANKAKRLIAKL